MLWIKSLDLNVCGTGALVLLDRDGLYKYPSAMVRSVGNSAELHSPVQDGVVYPKHLIFPFTNHPSAGWKLKKEKKNRCLTADVL